MKKTMTFLFILAISLGASAAELNIGVVNVQKVLVSIKEGKAVMGTLKKSFEKKQKRLKTEEEKVKKMQASFEKQSAVLSSKAKVKKQDEIRALIMGLQKTHTGYQQEMQKQEGELKKPILEKLKPIIDEVSKNAKIALTFEVQSSPIVYAKSSVDITEKVIKAYDKKYSK